ncbi:MAG TPA: SirB2 family protein [Steroidobacteraceae bacterium]|nr:SirB2 family protein [Steroidobacteraceae bacterium]
MPFAAHFPQILAVHVGSVVLSGTLFSVRASLRIAGRGATANWAALRYASYVIDSALLAAAVLLTLIIRQYPFVEAWLTAKVLLLAVYVVLGSIALKRARTRAGCAAATLGAWATYAAIIGVAVTREPTSWLALLAR